MSKKMKLFMRTNHLRKSRFWSLLKSSGLSFARGHRFTMIQELDTSSGLEIKRKYKLLNLLEFRSSRKGMSVIVRDENGAIFLFCKGADEYGCFLPYSDYFLENFRAVFYLIGFACSLLRNDMEQFHLCTTSKEYQIDQQEMEDEKYEILSQLQSFTQQISEENRKLDSPFALLVDGKALELSMSSELRIHFFSVAMNCDVVMF